MLIKEERIDRSEGIQSLVISVRVNWIICWIKTGFEKKEKEGRREGGTQNNTIIDREEKGSSIDNYGNGMNRGESWI